MVVDFPLPVTPVTSTSPRFRAVISFQIISEGSPTSSILGMEEESTRIT